MMSVSLFAEPHWIALTASSAARSRSADSSAAASACPYPSRKASRRKGLPSRAPYSRRTRSRTARPGSARSKSIRATCRLPGSQRKFLGTVEAAQQHSGDVRAAGDLAGQRQP
jgi:hypothetical protein